MLLFNTVLILTAETSQNQMRIPTDKCGTAEVLESFRQGVKFSRPTSGPKYVYSSHFIVHFETTGTHITTRAYAESVAKYAEYCWAKQVDTLKWAAPPPDNAGPDNRYDLYIRSLSAGVLGTTYAESPYSTPYPNGYTSYIFIDNDINSWASWDALRATVSHEFNHASQFRYSVAEGIWWYENTATWIEDVCYDEINDYINYLYYSTPNPLDSPYLAINSSSGLYWYAGAIWAMFLQEFYNDSCPRFCWERMGTVSGANTLSGINDILVSKFASNLSTALTKYAIWRYFTGDRADPIYHFSESDLWPTSELLQTHNSYPASGNQSTQNPNGPGGTNFIRFNPGSNALSITFDGQDNYNWSATAIGYRVPSQSIEQEISLDANAYGTTNISWSGNSHIALIPVVTHWTSTANNLTHTYSATEIPNIKDVGVTAIVNPIGSVDSSAFLTPIVRVKNNGTNTETFQATFRIIGTTYNSSRSKTLLPGQIDTINFVPWQPISGTYQSRCSLYLFGDQNKSNDTLSASFTVQVNGWFSKNSILSGTNNKNVKAGGAITAGVGGKIYALKGNNTREFYVYYINGDSWSKRETIPDDPVNRKRVNKGAALVYNKHTEPDMIYATKGNNTLEFLVYNVTANSWTFKPSVPVKLGNEKKVKGGACLAFVKRGPNHYVYLLKGNNTNEFYAYHCNADTWIKTLRPAPEGPDLKLFRDGSCMTVGANERLYVLKGGAKYNEFYFYETSADTWGKLESLPRYSPLTKKSSKIKDGAALCYNGDSLIYAFKGGNRQEFWQYNINRNRWTELETIPRSLSGKKVGSGGSLAFADGKVFALKGNNTREFWVYIPGQSNLSADNKILESYAISTLQTKPTGTQADNYINIFPNPFTKQTKIKLNLSEPNNVKINLYNSIGQQILLIVDKKYPSGSYTIPFNSQELASGIYHLRCEIGQRTQTIKMIIN
ncbi:MAG: T9SS type A sorting domain-containing protein [candidate division WOR-3 bacterium]|nr:T9SS type A sorting domain-containing protein [candidate division WOR-3 bacterium]